MTSGTMRRMSDLFRIWFMVRYCYKRQDNLALLSPKTLTELRAYYDDLSTRGLEFASYKAILRTENLCESSLRIRYRSSELSCV
jgi:hypothetical protein